MFPVRDSIPTVHPELTIRSIAWGAHVGGFATEMLLHPLFLPRTRREAHPDELGILAAWGGHALRRRR